MTIRLVDCTLRDGGNLNDWFFSDADVRTIVEKLDQTGVDLIEVGYRGGSGSKKAERAGKPARCDREFLEQLPRTRHAAIAVMVVPTACPMEKLEDLESTLTPWIRIAAYPRDVEKALPYVSHLKERGFHVGFNLMSASYVSPGETQAIAQKAELAGTDLFYIADSFGSLTPDGVAQRIRMISETVVCPIGFHGHNNLGLAFANALAAIDAGATYIDTSLCGMARGAGNLPTEQYVSAMTHWERFRLPFRVEPVLQAAEHVLQSILRSPMKITTPEITSGLSNLHYYYHDLVVARCKEKNLDVLTVSKLLGETLPGKVDPAYIDAVIGQLLSVKHEGVDDYEGTDVT